VIETVASGADQFTCLDGQIHSVYQILARRLAAPTYKEVFKNMVSFWANNPDARQTSVQIDVFPNQAAVAVPDATTAYPYRDTKAFLYVPAHSKSITITLADSLKLILNILVPLT
jgi:hypothetical protein